MKTFLKWVQRTLLPYPIAFLGKYLVRMLLYTCRIEIQGLEYFKKRHDNSRWIMTVWHNRIAIIPEVLNRFTRRETFSAVVSNSRDGKILKTVTQSYRRGHALPVSHDSRFKALKTLVKELKFGKHILVIAPDGPRGPRYEIKPGLLIASKQAEASIVPLTWCADRFWQLGSWDKMIFPKPFSKITIVIGEPISPPENHAADVLRDHLLMLDRKTCEQVTSDENAWPK